MSAELCCTLDFVALKWCSQWEERACRIVLKRRGVLLETQIFLEGGAGCEVGMLKTRVQIDSDSILFLTMAFDRGLEVKMLLEVEKCPGKLERRQGGRALAGNQMPRLEDLNLGYVVWR